MTAGCTHAEPATSGLFSAWAGQISPCDKNPVFPTIPDAEKAHGIARKAPPRIARQRADTPDESHIFSAQARRGLDRAPRGNMGHLTSMPTAASLLWHPPGASAGPPQRARKAPKGCKTIRASARCGAFKSVGVKMAITIAGRYGPSPYNTGMPPDSLGGALDEAAENDAR